MQENGSQVASAGYNWAGQMNALTYDSLNETRSFDPITLQLTRILAKQGATSVMDMTYGYTSGQNNGRITSSVDAVLNETVNYTYDSQNRLATAQATNNSWGNAYSYDGFANLTGATVTVGSAPYFSISIDPTTNRVVGNNYDANGNALGYAYSYTYDVENRMLLEPATFGAGAGSTLLGACPSNRVSEG